jgi:hypothetical protein
MTKIDRREGGQMNERYEAPQVKLLGSVNELTEQFDKIGSVDDIFTQLIPQLDGEIIPDVP